ncbi:MAG: LamG-like jellyroll fold domain-containing protein [Candidatus Bathyarchaeia archaeon]
MRVSVRGLSPLLATLILIAIVVSAGAAIYLSIMNMTSTFSGVLSVQLASANLVVSGNSALLTVSVKNAGNTPLAGIIVAGYDDNGKCFKLALPPAEPGQTSGNTLIIPLNVPFIALDGSGNNNHGAIYGATWVDGIYGKALSFDGADDYARIVTFDWEELFPNGFSIALYAHPLTYNIMQNHVLSNVELKPGANPNAYIKLYYNGADKRFEFSMRDTISGEGIWPFPPINSAPDLRWYHIVWSWDRQKHLIYQDGQLIRLATDTRTNKGIAYLGCDLGRGVHPPYYGNLIIDEMCVYDRASVEVESNVISKGLPPTDGLVLWLPLDEGSNVPFSFTAGGKYALTVTAYTFDGSTTTHAITVVAAA